jgi:beta-aspartyl-peptidase (threonine type)
MSVLLHRILLLLFLLSHLGLAQPATPEPSWAIVIHGGAGANAEAMTAEELAGLETALADCLRRGAEFLEQGGEAMDCVEMVVRALEDYPEFNAGKGAVLNATGTHDLDASIMDGRNLSCGAVAGVRTVKNPVSLARLVLDRTKHVMLAGDGAEEFATQCEVERVPNSYFTTPQRRLDWEKRQPYSKGTVGCVAFDQKGNLAAATSTGGLTNKKWGRVGDSPIVGAGCYADNATCGVSCTGTGEEFIRRAIAYDVGARMKYAGDSLEGAANETLRSLPPSCGGLIAIDHAGRIVAIFNTPGMSRGLADSTGKFQIGVGPKWKILE